MRINHNIPALTTLYQLNKTNSSLDKTLKRLSSGMRINSSADDAAGLAIVQKMDTQIRGLKQANRNANDGVSLIQTAEGALNEYHAMLQRIRELAVQASNGTLADEDRKAVNDEVVQLKKEMQRICDHIEFNEMTLLNGDMDRRSFSSDLSSAKILYLTDTVEPNDYTFKIDKAASKTEVLSGKIQGLFDTNGKVLIEEGTININGVQTEITKGDTTQQVYSKIRNICEKVNIELSHVGTDPFGNGEQLKLTHSQYGDKNINIKGTTELLDALGLTPNTESEYSVVVTQGNDVAINIEALQKSSSNFPKDTTVYVDGNIIEFQGNNDFNIKVETSAAADTDNSITLSILDAGLLDLQIGANKDQQMEVRIPNLSPKSLGFENINLFTSSGAQEAITIVDKAIGIVSSIRSKLGAYQNRLEHTSNNLSVATESLTASLSRIQDADMAEEMAEYTQKNIISQAGVSMLAQANQRPQQILQLLQG